MLRWPAAVTDRSTACALSSTVIEASMQTQLQSRLQAYGAELDSLQVR